MRTAVALRDATRTFLVGLGDDGYTGGKPPPSIVVGVTGPREKGHPVAYAYVQDVAASWEHYERVTGALVEPAPIGLIAHVAGPTDDGVRIIEIWDTREDFERFRSERLAPAITALGGPERSHPTFRGLQPKHVFVPKP
jgi:hypothetical protein